MNRHLLVSLALVLASCNAAPPPGVQQQGVARELVGRTAGAPERCTNIVSQQSLRVADGDPHILLYGDAFGRTLWANHLGQCRFGSDDILVTYPTGSVYCRGDLVRSIDRISHIPGPACVLSDFVPYTRR